MSRPSARRRPTALRLTETDQTFVLLGSSITFLALACTVYLYKHSRQVQGDGALWHPSHAIFAGLILCGSGLQRQARPIKECAATMRIPQLGDTAAILVLALSTWLKFAAIQALGADRAIAMLLPIECLLRAQRGGFMSRQPYERSVMAFALIVSCISDVFSDTTTSNILVGYGLLALVYMFGHISLELQYDKGDLSTWSGLLLIASGSMACFFSTKSFHISYLDIIAIVSGVFSRAWYATQPKAIWTSLSLAWPVIVGLFVFVGFNITHSISWAQLASYGLLYYALFSSIQLSTSQSSTQSTAKPRNFSTRQRSNVFYYITEITKDKESRDIFYFLLLNLTFMVVQMLYGIWTNSLGLISDSIHMLFDCLALAVGLVAAVMSKWPASQNHPFGFAKVEIISGFANGIFLVLISFSIMIEALERLMEPPEMKTDQLLLISTLGLGVNLVGIFAFNHGHHHHHGHSHGHEHEHSHAEKPEPLPTIHTPKPARNDGTFDHARGLQSPMPDFSNFAGFDSPQLTSNGFDAADSSLENGKSRSRLSLTGAETNGHASRARSPIRRPGSPLKPTHEPVLADLAEVNERTPEQKLKHSHSHDTQHSHEHHHHNHNHADGDKENTRHQHGKHLKPTQTPAHARNLSYDLTAEHSHVHNSSSSHAHHHNHDHGHDHKHGHDHSHNMEGIFLHILADTLGSGGVIVSTILIRLFGWTGFDPLASIFIAVLIFLSVIPLLKSSFRDLLMTLQDDQEYTLREVLGEVSLISGVSGIPFIRFWVDGEQKMHGILTISAGIDGDTDLVRQKVRRKLEDGVPNLADVIVQVDRLE